MYSQTYRRIAAFLLVIMLVMTSATAFAQDAHANQLDEVEQAESSPKNEDAVHAMVKIFNSLLNFSHKVKTHISNEPSPLIYINQNITITERVPVPPLINQFEYPQDPYGKHGSIASHGCGISSVTMLYSYLLDTELDIVEMAKTFGKYNTPTGSSWSLFENTAKHFNIPEPTCTYSRKEVINALENGQMVIALQRGGLFADGGHFILLTGIAEDGKITVNDSNGWNYRKNSTLKNGFKNGFTQGQIFANGGPYWIYEAKDIDITTLNDERVTVTYEIQVIPPKEESAPQNDLNDMP